MARKKKEIHKVEMTDGKRAIIQQLFQEYNIESATDIQDALKDLLGGTIKEMMETEMDEHLGYSKSEPATDTKPSVSTAVMAVFRLMSRRIVSPPSSPRLSRSGRRIFPPLTRKLSLCMPKA